jgi:hypothetical protein
MDALDILVDLDERQVMLRVPGQYRLKVITFLHMSTRYIRVIHKLILSSPRLRSIDGLLCWNWQFSAPHCMTSTITLLFFHLIYANWTSYKFPFSCWEKAFFIMYTYADFGHGKFCNRLSWGTQWMNHEDEHNGIKLNTNSISPFLFVLHQNPYLWTLLYKNMLVYFGFLPFFRT